MEKQVPFRSARTSGCLSIRTLLFTNKQLDQIADHDAIASFILATRLDNQAERHARFVNAFVLSGEAQAFNAIIQNDNSGLESYAYDEDGALANRQDVYKQYVWARVGERLGYTDPDTVISIRETLDSDEVVDLTNFDQLAEDVVDMLVAMRQEKTGEGF